MNDGFDPDLLDVNLLQTFYAVVRFGSVSAAARRLLRTQPAISSRIKQLEEQLGIRLFEKVGRNLRPTPAGVELLGDVKQILSQLQRLKDRSQSLDDRPMGTLHIGVLPTLCTYQLPECLARFRHRYPQVHYSIKPDLTAQNLDRLQQGEIDVLFSASQPPHDPRLEVLELGAIRAVAVLPKSHPLAIYERLGASQLAHHPLISYGQIDDPFFTGVWQFIERHGLKENIAIFIPNISATKTLVQAGAGISILPQYVVVEHDLVTRDVEGLDVFYPFWMAIRRTGRQVPLLRHFLKAVEELFPTTGVDPTMEPVL